MLVLVKGAHGGLLYASVHLWMVKVSVMKRTDRQKEHLLSRDPGTPSFQDSGVYLLWVIQMAYWDHTASCPFPKMPRLSQLKEVGVQVSTKDRSVALGLRTSDSNSINRGRNGREPRE